MSDTKNDPNKHLEREILANISKFAASANMHIAEATALHDFIERVAERVCRGLIKEHLAARR